MLKKKHTTLRIVLLHSGNASISLLRSATTATTILIAATTWDYYYLRLVATAILLATSTTITCDYYNYFLRLPGSSIFRTFLRTYLYCPVTPLGNLRDTCEHHVVRRLDSEDLIGVYSDTSNPSPLQHIHTHTVDSKVYFVGGYFSFSQ